MILRSRWPAWLLALAFLTVAWPAGATGHDQSLGVTPADVVIADAQPGERYRTQITIQNQFDSPSRITLEHLGEVGAWTTTSPNGTFTVPARTHEVLDLTIAVPDDAYPGQHDGFLRVVAEAKDRPSGSGFSLQWSVSVPLNVTVGGELREALSWGAASAPDVAIGSPVEVLVEVRNTGNTRTTARAQATLHEQATGQQLSTATGGLELLPGEEATLVLTFPEPVPEGTYEVHVTSLVDDGLDEELLVKVLPPGSLGKDGFLRFISHDSRVQAGRPVAVSAVFENIGNVSIAQARFTGQVFLDGELVGVVESQPRVVAVGHLLNLTGFFTPQEPGKHVIRGTVTYDGFETDEKESFLNVQGEASRAPSTWTSWLPYLIIALLGAWLVVLYVRGRREDEDPERPDPPA